MISRQTRHKLFYVAAIGISIILFFIVISSNWIGYDIKIQCQNATKIYQGDCVEALTSLVNDETQSYRARNSAIWALGQLGDRRPLPALKKLYSGNIPAHESYDENISQYELSKAIKWLESGMNLFAWTWRWNIDTGQTSSSQNNHQTLILSESQDPYYELAEKIAANEKLDIIHTIEDIQKSRPETILMVAAPENLSEEKLVNIARLFKKNDYYPAFGIITGSTQEIAEDLYERSKLAKEGENYIASDKDVKSNIDRPLIIKENIDGDEEIELTENSLIETLSKADYLYWARHVSATKWSWNSESEIPSENDKLWAKELPALKPVIIHTPSCGSLLPWKEESIALGFIDHGAAAYIGHMHSPVNSGIFIGHCQYLPGKFTWKDFPLGIMTQVQNHNTSRVAFDIPLFFMLGDPRIYLSQSQPYEIISDHTYQNERIIEATTDRQGIIPVKIDGGARYSFTQIDGISTIDDKDLFYNSKIQALNLNNDKYILFKHSGGDFTIQLQNKPPLFYTIIDPLVDALDHSWVIIGVVLSPLSFVFLLAFIGILYFKVLRKKTPPSSVLPVLGFALIFAVTQCLYIYLRMDAFTVSSYTYNHGYPELIMGFIGTFSSISSGLILMMNARKTSGKILGLLISILPQFLLTSFYFITYTVINILFLVKNPVPIILWNYINVLLPLIVLIIDMLPVYLFYILFIKNKPHKVPDANSLI